MEHEDRNLLRIIGQRTLTPKSGRRVKEQTNFTRSGAQMQRFAYRSVTRDPVECVVGSR